MTECVTWDCTRPGIAHLTVRRPCGHPVALNSSGLGPLVRWCTPPVGRSGPRLCAHTAVPMRIGETIACYPGRRSIVTCPECLEWLHA